MIAEIRGKISSSGSNLNDRLEDKLTGDIFGTLRYLTFEKGLKRILEKVNIYDDIKKNIILKSINDLSVEYWDNNISFWPNDKEGEIDVMLDFESVVLGIEVKYLSGLSSDDDVDNSKEENFFISKNQLARESRIIKRRIENRDKTGVLIFLAVGLECKKIYDYVSERNILDKEILFGTLSWEDVHDVMGDLLEEKHIDHRDEIILKDLFCLLKKKRI